MQLERVLTLLREIAPLELAEEWDNVGLLLSPTRSPEVDRVLLTIDLTAAVFDEAVQFGAQLIVAYHPPIFAGLKRITNEDRTGALVLGCIERSIAVYSPHTALDAALGGVNDWLASAFDHRSARALAPKGALIGASDDLTIGQGRLIELSRPIDANAAIAAVKQHLQLERLRHAISHTASIQTVALCPGAGGALLAGVAADLYLTGEMRHHDVLAATARGTHVILTDHTNSERGYLPSFAERICAHAPHVTCRVATVDADPLSIV